MMGRMDSPSGLREYSTRGGTSGYTLRVTRPSSSIERRLSVSTFWLIPSRSVEPPGPGLQIPEDEQLPLASNQLYGGGDRTGREFFFCPHMGPSFRRNAFRCCCLHYIRPLQDGQGVTKR